jgi:hypothetical protein
MIPGDLPLTIFRGSPVNYALTVKDSEGAAVDLTGLTFSAQVRKGPLSDTVFLNMTVTGTDLTNGKLSLTASKTLTAAITTAGNAAWDMIDSNGNKWLSGAVLISDNVTKP